MKFDGLKWIKCNLPWSGEIDSVPNEVFDSVKWPEDELDVLTREKFGTTHTEVSNKIETIGSEEILFDKFLDLQSKYDYEKTREELINLTEDTQLKEYLRLTFLRSEIQMFENQTDIIAKYNEERNKVINEYKASRPKKSFWPDLAKPGVLIELESGKRLLIGDINSNGGVCDDCRGISDSDVVVRYAVIYDD